MKGSWSIKAVLPTVAPDLDYAALGEVLDGTAAQAAYGEILDPATPEERRRTLARDLRDYCRLDTLAMVRLAGLLARMKRELAQMVEAQNQAAQAFQIRVVSELEAMRARKAAEVASTTHGHDFQQACFAALRDRANRAGDIVEDTGNSTGAIKYSKVGDAVVTLGPDNAAAGARIAIETKKDASYTLKSGLDEIAIARQNREAGVGLFIHSCRTAPAGLEPLARYGNDIVVIWDAEDETTDAWLKAGLLTAKALAVRAATDHAERAADFQTIDKSLAEIQRQVKCLEDIRTWSGTIKNNAEKVIDRADRMQKALDAELDTLVQQVAQLKNPA